MIRIKEMLKNLMVTFIQLMKRIMGEKKVCQLRNFTPYPIIINTNEGNSLSLLPSAVVVRLRKKPTYTMELRGKKLHFYPNSNLEIDGLDELFRMRDEEIGIVTEDVFDAIKKNCDLSWKFKRRIATLPCFRSKMEGLAAVVQMQDLLVL